jgi:hypothetical protein
VAPPGNQAETEKTKDPLEPRHGTVTEGGETRWKQREAGAQDGDRTGLGKNPQDEAREFALNPTSAVSERLEPIIGQFWHIGSQNSFIFNDEFFQKRK